MRFTSVPVIVARMQSRVEDDLSVGRSPRWGGALRIAGVEGENAAGTGPKVLTGRLREHRSHQTDRGRLALLCHDQRDGTGCDEARMICHDQVVPKPDFVLSEAADIQSVR
jgi:hypothetical protein